MTAYIKTDKNQPFKKINIFMGEDDKPQKEELELSLEESTALEDKYNQITSPLSDFETLISFDVYNLNSLNGILNYRNENIDHKQIRY